MEKNHISDHINHDPKQQSNIDLWFNSSLLFSPPIDQQPNNPLTEIAASVANFLGTDNSDNNTAEYRIYSDMHNLPTAIASILNSVQNRAQFYPAQDSAEGVATSFSRYIHEFEIAPFFSKSQLEHIRQSVASNDYNQLIDQIVSLYEGVSDIDRQYLKDSIRSMVQTVVNYSNPINQKALLCQLTINYNNPNTPKILIYYTSLMLSYSEEGKLVIPKQEYQLTKSVYDVIPSRIRDNAGALTRLERKTVNDWILSNTSHLASDKIALCFPHKPYQT